MQQLKVESTTAIVQPRFSMHQTKDSTDLIWFCYAYMNGTLKLIVQAGAMILQHNFVDKEEAIRYLIQFQPKKCKKAKVLMELLSRSMKEIPLTCRHLQSLICFRWLKEWTLQAIASWHYYFWYVYP